ncbi:LppU/SCO3897 family protein [Amycolatopsis magusensis]|uniref:Uncharacterized protein n=1 Tax=Amycolatopsis magusensis TaxID=882444 RepID=A0ABS4PH97_9PSEU|nr:hypothetical protein [Amycolatopsis magusensis]MBP2178782.1 hypothetical protein [Amycolatopsis magusensis]MDI5980230.1 hypothetical protein [Amycolatopsis magusensis]
MSVPPPPSQPQAQPGPYGPPPGQPDGGFGAPPPPAPKKNKALGLLLKIGVPVLVVLVAGVIGILNFVDSPATSNVGDCLNVTQFNSTTEPTKADCASPEANLRIGAKLDGSSGACPAGGTYDEYTVSGRGSYKLCLVLNVKQGECVANFSAGETGYKRVPCTDPSAEVEFLKVAEGVVDEALCEGTEAEKVLTYPQPATTLCFRQVQA